MPLTVSVFPKKFQTKECTPTHPVLLNMDDTVNVFMDYKQALELARLLRIACGVDLPQEEAAA